MYQWQFNGSDITGEISSMLILPSVQASNGGMYTCVVTNTAGSDEDSTFLYISPYFVTQPMDVLTTNGSSITLLCEAEAFPSPAIQWRRADREPIRNGIDTHVPMLVIDHVIFGDEGNYYCTASSQNVTIHSHDATVIGMIKQLYFNMSIIMCVVQFLLLQSSYLNPSTRLMMWKILLFWTAAVLGVPTMLTSGK